MTENMKCNAIVKGPKGVAEFAYEHLKDIENGCAVDFALNNPIQDEDATADRLRFCAEAWCGIMKTETPLKFDDGHTVLYVDYYGGSGDPQLASVGVYGDDLDRSVLETAIRIVSDAMGYGLGDEELVYVECVEREED